MRRIPQAPHDFDGSLDQLYNDHAKHVLIAADQVAVFHRVLMAYLKTGNQVYLIRKVGDLVRRETIRTKAGYLIRATDNSPAWFIHHELFASSFSSAEDFGAFIEKVPCHVHDVQLPQNVSSEGWHVAHLFDVNNRDTDFKNWSNDELVRRMVLSIHPCNYFYIPKSNWRHYGRAKEVLSYFYGKFSALYHDVWKEFLAMAEAQPIPYIQNCANFEYSIGITGAPVSAKAKSRPSGMDEMVFRLPDYGVTGREWTIRDDNRREHYGDIPKDQQIITITLNWKPDRDTAAKLIGKYRINLGLLLQEGYVRESNRGIRLRFQRTGNDIEIAVDRNSPALIIGKKPE